MSSPVVGGAGGVGFVWGPMSVTLADDCSTVVSFLKLHLCSTDWHRSCSSGWGGWRSRRGPGSRPGGSSGSSHASGPSGSSGACPRRGRAFTAGK